MCINILLCVRAPLKCRRLRTKMKMDGLRGTDSAGERDGKVGSERNGSLSRMQISVRTCHDTHICKSVFDLSQSDDVSPLASDASGYN